MRHRIGIASSTGLGNPAPEILDNSGSLNSKTKKCLDEAIKLYFQKWNGCDYSIGDNEIKFGIEPAYQFDALKIISVNKKIGKSYLEIGRAFGDYGSGIRAKRRYYKDYEKNGKFKKFIDKWQPMIWNS